MKLTRFQLKDTLYQSARARVVRAVRDDETCVVLKILDEDRASPSETARYEREFDVLRRISSDRVIRAYELLREGSARALVLEDFGGASLDHLLAAGSLDLPAALDVAIRAGAALRDVHDAQVTHGDVKPSNFVSDASTLKIIDFDRSTTRTDAKSPTRTATLEGNLAYLAPEQTGRTNRAVDHRSDLYSFGVTLYELFTGRLPFGGDDPLEVIHGHLARTPTPPHSLDPRVPRALSAVVLKLLEKNPSARYQSASGLLHDLVRCASLTETPDEPKSDRPFSLGERDTSEVAPGVERLYGRDSERATLAEADARAADGSLEFVLIEGESGVGKTSLAMELSPMAAARRATFVAASFEQATRHVPCAAIVSAVRQLVRRMLGETDARLAEQRVALRSRLGESGAVLAAAVPELEHVMGPQPAVPKAGPVETQNLFLLALEGFLDVVCQPGRPLVLFLDDMQWADESSFKLLRTLLSDSMRAHLMVAAALRVAGPPTADRANRRDGASAHHPVHGLLTLEGLRTTHIVLEPLTREALVELCAETLSVEPAAVEPLSDLILRKTAGNPFFVDQFSRSLRKGGLLWLDRDTGRWSWDLARIEAFGVTDNVADLFEARIDDLPAEAREAAALATAIGSPFSLPLLALAMDRTVDDAAQALAPVLEAGLVAESQSGFAFTHERLTDLLRSRLPGERAASIQLRLARHLLAARRAEDTGDALFTIVAYLNGGAPAITSEDERLTRARLNLEAGRRLKTTGGYVGARDHFRAAMDAVSWKADPSFARTVWSECADSEYLLGNARAADKLTQTLLERATTDFERADVFRKRVLHYTVRGLGKAAIESGRRALALLGITVPQDDVVEVVRREYAELERLLAGRDIEALLDLPEAREPEILSAMQVLDALQPSTYQFAQPLYAFVVIKLVNLTLRYGSSIHAVSGYSALFAAFWLVSDGGSVTAYRLAHRFGRVAVRLAERYENDGQRSRALLRLASCLAPWVSPIRDTIAIFDEAHRLGLSSGELQGAGLNLQYRAINAYFVGTNLEQMARDLREHGRFAKRHGQDIVRVMLEAVRAPVARLRGSGAARPTSEEPTVDAGLDAEAEAFLGTYGAWPIHGACFLIYAADALFILGQHERALAFARQADARRSAITGLVLNVTLEVVHSLALLARWDALSPSERRDAEARVVKSEERLGEWAAGCPENFAHLRALVRAERARTAGRRLDAMDGYDVAVEGAARSGVVSHEALASELAGRFWLEQNKPFLAGPYLRRALDAYGRWGAYRKVDSMRTQYRSSVLAPELEARRASPRVSPAETAAGGSFDALTIVKASQAISQEVEFNALVSRLTRIVMENAGADRGALILKEEAGLAVYVNDDLDEIVHRGAAHATPLDEDCRLPTSVIHYVVRTGKAVVLGDPANDLGFGRDPDIVRRNPKSLLAVPLIARGAIRGALYIEHAQLGDAFGPERLHLLETLASQAAISLDNALLYQALWANNRELEQALESVEENVHLRKELEIAARIQTCILPNRLLAPRLDISASMHPASEVGGDYYDVLPTEDGAWIGIGDVAGHGLNAGVVMLMTQTAVATLVRQLPDAEPSRVLAAANDVLYENIRHRLGRDEFVTLTLMRYRADGTIVFCGAHEDVIVWRAGTRECEIVKTTGPWLGAMADLRGRVTDETLRLEPGDVLVLYTDGVTEAMNEEREQFGLTRLLDVVAKSGDEAPERIRRAVLGAVDAWATSRRDDVTILVARFG